MRYSAGHKDQTHERLLQEAAASIRQRGVAGTTIADVTAASGITHGGFYAHFKSREDMVTAAVADMVSRNSVAQALSSPGGPPAEVLGNYVDFYLSAQHRDGETATCPLPYLAAEGARLPQAAVGQLADSVANLAELIARHLEALGHPDPEAEASSVLSELMGALTLARADVDRVRSGARLEGSRQAVRRRLGLAPTPQPGKDVCLRRPKGAGDGA